MGRNKAFLEFEGKPLIDKNLAILESLFTEVLISSNTPELYSRYPEKVVPDHYTEQGPLGGLQACLQEMRTEVAFFAACDIPLIQPELIRFMASLTEGYDVVLPKTAEGLHPLFAFYKRSCLPQIKNSLQTGRLRIIDFYPYVRVRYVEEEAIAQFGDPQWLLFNVNTPEEWTRFQQNVPKG